MNHIRLLIRNQCGSHIIHGIPNPLAFQQNYSRYDGPSESGSFFTLSKPGLTSFLLDFDVLNYSISKYCFYLINRINQQNYNHISEAVVVEMNTDTFKYDYDTTRVFFEWQVQSGKPDRLELQYRYRIIFMNFQWKSTPTPLIKTAQSCCSKFAFWLYSFFFTNSKTMCSWLILGSKNIVL